MTKKEKALQKLRHNPKHVRFEELEDILIRLGFQKRQDGTSHAMFTLGEHNFNVPKRKPFVEPKYEGLALKVLDQIEIEDHED